MIHWRSPLRCSTIGYVPRYYFLLSVATPLNSPHVCSHSSLNFHILPRLVTFSQVLLLLSTPYMCVPAPLTSMTINSTQYSSHELLHQFSNAPPLSLPLIYISLDHRHGCTKLIHMCHRTRGRSWGRGSFQGHQIPWWRVSGKPYPVRPMLLKKVSILRYFLCCICLPFMLQIWVHLVAKTRARFLRCF
jgi:hypothetical protein